MNKLPHQIAYVLKYTGLATFCATEHNSCTKKERHGWAYMALSYSSEDTTGHSKMSN